MVMNVTTYGLTLVAARALGPVEFGEFSAVLGSLIILNVLSLGLQSTAARRIASGPTHQLATGAGVKRVTVQAAAVICVVGILASPAISALLDLGSTTTAVALVLAAALLTLMGGLAGILQGEERWVALSLVYSSMGIARLVVGVGAMALASTAQSLSLAVAVAATFPVLIAYQALRRPAVPGARAPVGADPYTHPDWTGASRLWSEVAHNSHALLAFFMLSNIDVVVARSFIPATEAGLYAAGSVLTKAVLFMPQFVVIVAFPAMARRTSGTTAHLFGLAVVALVGLTSTAGVAALLDVALEFVGGGQYWQVKSLLPLFAVVGTALAMTQLLVYSAIAGRHRAAVWPVWAAVAVFVLLAVGTDDARGLLHAKLVVDGALLVILAGFVLTRPGEVAVHSYEPALVEDLVSPEQPPVR
ncbi:hypothetical protein AWH69_12510 [Janibacter melonis]|uniref:Polysaccharide biosynthesis protein n=2 Tax=Janibacter melonis TaxID=262209 RepID=A0A176QBX4_9MICO|nr:hypothetical protein AWH69_12510 [Janibacter melonis]